MKAVVSRLYRWALFLLPPSFRRSYGSAMAREAEADLKEISGPLGAIGAVARLVGDFVRSWLREWTAALAETVRVPRWTLLSDARYAVRSFRRAPAFTATVVLTLAVGIGANTAIFSVVNATLLRPLPYQDSDRLVAVWPGKLFSRSLMSRIQGELASVPQIAGTGGIVLALTEGGNPVEVFGRQVTPNFFDILGVQPEIGRGFSVEDGEPGATPVTILSHRIWMERFGGSPDLIGRSIELQSEESERRTVVGVLSADFVPIDRGAEAWIPVVTDPTEDGFTNSSFMDGIGRLSPEADLRAATAAVAAFAASVREENPSRATEQDVQRASVTSLAQNRAGSLRTLVLALFGSVGLVLLIACVNVANLLLARTSRHAHMIRIRSALGASRSRIFSQLLTEGVLLGLAGGVVGVGVALLSRGLLLDIVPGGFTAADVPIDLPVLTFTLGVSALSGLVFGSLPALKGSRRGMTSVAGSERGGTANRRSHRLQHTLMAGEVGLALVAVFAAGVLGTSARDLAHVDPGFDPENVLTLRLTAPPASYPTDDDVVRYFDLVRDRIATVPGVEAVGVGSNLPLGSGRSEITIFPEGFEPGPDGELPDATHRLMSPGFGETLGFRLQEGRLVSDADMVSEQPFLGYVNRALADRYWPDGAVGKSFLHRGPVLWLTVVGVIDDVRETELTGPVAPAIYIPHRDWARRSMYVVVRSSIEPESLRASVEQAIWAVDASIPISQFRTMERIVAASMEELRVTGILFSVFGGLALFLGGIGVYGVVSHSLSERRREFGIRIALGASTRKVTRQAIRQAGVALAIGLGIGLLVTPYVGTVLTATLSGVRADSIGLVIVTVVSLSAIALGAAWLPARTATRVDPAESLRLE